MYTYVRHFLKYHSRILHPCYRYAIFLNLLSGTEREKVVHILYGESSPNHNLPSLDKLHLVIKLITTLEQVPILFKFQTTYFQVMHFF